jgi:hypothetical protein
MVVAVDVSFERTTTGFATLKLTRDGIISIPPVMLTARYSIVDSVPCNGPLVNRRMRLEPPRLRYHAARTCIVPE